MAINDVWQLTVRGTISGQLYLHTLHFLQLTSAVSDTAAGQDLIDDWQAACQASWLALHTAVYTLGQVEALKVCGAAPLPAPVQEIVNAAGTRGVPAGEIAATWLAGMVRESTPFRGREYRGRFFTAGLYESDLAGLNLHATYSGLLTAYATSLNVFFQGGANMDWDLFVFSRKLQAAGNQCQLAGAPVTSLGVSNALTTQKSRR